MKFYLCGFKNDNVAEVRKHYLDFHNVDPNNQFFKRLFDESEDNVFRAGQCIRCKQFIPSSSSRKCHNFEDGLTVLKNESGPQSEHVKKIIRKIFKEHELDIIIQCNMKIVNYLDVTFNLNDGTYKP